MEDIEFLDLEPGEGEKYLEKILNILSKPNYAIIRLFNDFDYSDLAKQVKELIPEIDIKYPYKSLKFYLEDPTKERLLNIYKARHKPNNIKGPNSRSKGIELSEIGWSQLERQHVKYVLPIELEINYHGEEPEYVCQLRDELLHTRMRVSIFKKS